MCRRVLEPFDRRQTGEVDGAAGGRDRLQFRRWHQGRREQPGKEQRQRADAAQGPFQSAKTTA